MNEHNEYLADKIYKLSISKSFVFSNITKESKSNAFDNFKELRNKATIPTNNDGLAMYYLAIQNGQFTAIISSRCMTEYSNNIIKEN